MDTQELDRLDEDELSDAQINKHYRGYFMQELTLTLTKDEGQTLYELIDLAVKAGGVQVAKVAVPIVDKLMAEAAKLKEKDSD